MTVIFWLSYFLLLAVIVFYSWGFVHPYSYLPRLNLVAEIIRTKPAQATVIYLALFTLLSIFYFIFLRLIRKKQLTIKTCWLTILATVIILVCSYPAFSYDIFNYIATARVTFTYRENPYLIMPIEIPNEPLLGFMHAANKTALYGPIWIALTSLPHLIGRSNLLLTVFAFKGFVALFYLGLSYLIWRLSNKNLWSLAFFALNPLVIWETLVSGHNDVAMMFFVMAGFFYLKQRKILRGSLLLVTSILTKFSPLLLLPLWIYLVIKTERQQKIAWDRMWKWCSLTMYLAFFLSPLREEIYAWYFIWPLSFVAISDIRWLTVVSGGFSLGLPLRFAPYLATGSWSGITPLVKKIVTFVPPMVAEIGDLLKLKLRRSQVK